MGVLDKELEVYRRERPRLLAEGERDKYVLIKGEHIVGLYGSLEEGLKAAYERFGLDTPFFLREIAIEEPVPIHSPSLGKWPTSPSP